MLLLEFFILILELYTVTTVADKITVLISQQDPFITFKNEKAMGLDISILRNFAKKFNHDIEFITTNESLNVIFDSNETTMNFDSNG